jgi:ethanolamine utilization cobalamin adenosyltransferase
MQVVTEETLRARHAGRDGRTVRVDPGAYLTQTARDYIREHGLEVIYQESGVCQDTDAWRLPGNPEDGFTDEKGNSYRKKPEQLTHLRGRLLVSKDHPRIAFRGMMDGLQAKILETQIAACRSGRRDVAEALEEFLDFARRLLAAEVKEAPFGAPRLLGLEDEDLREASHDPQKHCGARHVFPSYRMGETVVALNALRAFAREAELCAVRAFAADRGDTARPDIVRALNRFSSAVYVMICRMASGERFMGVTAP